MGVTENTALLELKLPALGAMELDPEAETGSVVLFELGPGAEAVGTILLELNA